MQLTKTLRDARLACVAVNVAFVFLFGVVVTAGSASAQTRGDTMPGGTAGNTPPPTSDSRSSRTTSTPSSNVSTRAFESGIASPVTATSATSVRAAAANALAYYGSWLDDASIVEPGKVWISLASGYWRGSGSRQIDAPVATAVVGINSRIHAGGSLSFFHFRDPDGLSERGFGSMALYTKFSLVDPAKAPVGIAVSPLIDFPPGVGEKIGWALPVNIEVRSGNVRVYGSAGYFSRGSVFGTVAAEIPLGSRASLTGSFGQAYATDATRHTSLGVGSFLTMTSTTGVFVGLGQTFMPSGVGPGGLSFAGGLSFFVADPTPPSVP